MPRLLTKAEIARGLRGLEGWRQKGRFISKTFKFKTFLAGISFVNDLAAIAEREEHHPDIRIRYTTIEVSIQTHSEGGVTERDVGLAGAIEKFLHQKPAEMR